MSTTELNNKSVYRKNNKLTIYIDRCFYDGLWNIFHMKTFSMQFIINVCVYMRKSFKLIGFDCSTIYRH